MSLEYDIARTLHDFRNGAHAAASQRLLFEQDITLVNNCFLEYTRIYEMARQLLEFAWDRPGLLRQIFPELPTPDAELST